VRKGFAFPRASALTNPLGSAGRLSLPAEPRGRREAVCAGKPEAFRTAGGRAAFSATLTRPWDFSPQGGFSGPKIAAIKTQA